MAARSQPMRGGKVIGASPSLVRTAANDEASSLIGGECSWFTKADPGGPHLRLVCQLEDRLSPRIGNVWSYQRPDSAIIMRHVGSPRSIGHGGHRNPEASMRQRVPDDARSQET